MKMHCFIYGCSECSKPYNQCLCYCQTCGTYLRFFKQFYFKDGDMHCLIYGCSECFKPYNQCFCYCQTCGTYLRFCKQLYFKGGDMTEDDTIDIVGLGF